MPFSPCITFVATSLKSRSIRYKYVHFMPVFEFSPEKNLWPWNWALKMAKIFSCTVKKGFKKNSTIGRTLLHENTVAGQLSLIKKITFEIQPIFQLLMQTFHTNPVKFSFFTYYIIYTVHVNEAWYENKWNFDWICMEGLQEEFFQSVLPLCCFPNCLCVYFFLYQTFTMSTIWWTWKSASNVSRLQKNASVSVRTKCNISQSRWMSFLKVCVHYYVFYEGILYNISMICFRKNVLFF